VQFALYSTQRSSVPGITVTGVTGCIALRYLTTAFTQRNYKSGKINKNEFWLLRVVYVCSGFKEQQVIKVLI
jgi:hypothetical protein